MAAQSTGTPDDSPGSSAIVPVFILSLPRTGSTLLQRLLGSHEAIGTASEPWFLLPLLYSLRERGVDAEYEHIISARGIQGFLEEYVPGGTATYLAEIRDLALRLYGRAAPGKRYFLDKTPRYHHIAADLFDLFPQARFVFLWRHPLAVAASFMDTWAAGSWNLDVFASDLFVGLSHLVDAYTSNGPRATTVRYEDLVTRPQVELERILTYLELPFDDTIIDRFSQLPMQNRDFWDPKASRFGTISDQQLDTWKLLMANPLRKTWCRRYIRWIGPERLELMGYEPALIEAEIQALATSPHHLRTDLVRAAQGYGRRRRRSITVNAPFPLWRPGPSAEASEASGTS
jgi:hypothetical protein